MGRIPQGWTEIEADDKPLFADAEREARTIENIAYCLGVYDTATWEGWTITRLPSGERRTINIDAIPPDGRTCVSKDYPARIGRPLPFDRYDTERMLAVYGARLAR